MASAFPQDRLQRVSCPVEKTLADGRHVRCSYFLFEAAPDYAARIIIRCGGCRNFLQITELGNPVVLRDYESPNQIKFNVR